MRPELALPPPCPRKVEALGKLDATHPDKTAPGGAAGAVEGSHDPSGAPAIRDNLAYDKSRQGEHPL
jgi:hypothetical protein